MLKVDPRTKFFTVILLGLSSMFLPPKSGIILIIYVSVYLAINGLEKKALKYLVIYSSFYALYSYVSRLEGTIVKHTYFILLLMVKMLPVIFSSKPLLTGCPGIIITGFRALKLPGFITLPLTVIVRYAPMLRLEVRAIREMIFLRGLSFNLRGFISHPLKIIEWGLIPLLMKSLKISEELSASAHLRGIEAPGKKSSYRELSFGLIDFLLLSLLLLTLFFSFRGVYGQS